MKKMLILILIIFSISKSYSQKEEIIGAGAAAVAGAIGIKLAIDIIKEQFEHEAVEWVLSNDSSKKFNLKLMSFDATKLDNLNSVSAIPFIVRKPDPKNSYVLIFVLSPGWYNEYGVDFTFVQPLIFNLKRWEKLMLKYLNLSSNVSFDDINYIPSYKEILYNKARESKLSEIDNNYILNQSKGYEYTGIDIPLSEINNINNNVIVFKSTNYGNKRLVYPLIDYLDGDTHFITDLDDDLLIDFNEKNFNIFIKKTKDLFRLKRSILVDITKELYED